MTRDTFDRRTMLKTMAVGAATATIAGCSSDGGSSDDSGGDESGGDQSGSDDSSGDQSNDDGSGDQSGGDDSGESVDFGGWFDDADNYDGVVDETGSSEVTVSVGAQGNGGGFAFDPAAVRVDSGTTVVWEWTGDGGNHNVSAENGDFESETVGEPGHAFEHTFEDSGTYKYACTPHKTMGMKGAVVVE